MTGATRSGTADVVPVVSLGLAILTVALVVIGLPLVVAPARTDRYFSWTIDVPLTASFLGACYWTAAVFTLLAARERAWACARAVMPGILVAGTLILVATLVHLEQFAMDTARGWIWVILYAGLAPGALLLLALQRRAAGGDPPARRPIERWAAILLVLAAGAALAIGASLFAFPGTTSAWWLWPLAELTARMVGAWLAAIGVTLVAVLLEGDWARVRAAMVYLAAVAAAHLATLARDPGAVAWDDVASWVYVAFYTVLFALAVRGVRARPEQAAGAPAPAIRQRAG